MGTYREYYHRQAHLAHLYRPTPWWAFWRPAWRRWSGHIECDWEYATDKQVAREFLKQEFDREDFYRETTTQDQLGRT